MAQLAGFLDVLLRGLGLIALSAAAGGAAFGLAVLLPLRHRAPAIAAALRRALAVIAAGAGVLAGSRAVLLLVVHPWALADEHGRWPLAAFLATDFGRAGVVGIALAVLLALAAWRGRRAGGAGGWSAVGALALALLAEGAWLSHATSRLEGRGPLMLVTAMHQAGAAVWLGGVLHLVAAWPLWRHGRTGGRTPSPMPAGGAPAIGALVLARFSALAIGAMALVVGPGVALSWRYVGDGSGLVGTGYWIMVLTKLALLAGALALGAVNFAVARRWTRGTPPGPGSVRPLLEVELGVGATILLAAASLTSLPPAVDVVADRATPAEVLARFAPQAPRVASPPVGQLLARAGAIDDALAVRQPEEYAWSEYNHHMAGVFVAGMAALALAERTGRAAWARHWPLGFLGLAGFLFVRNDPRAWPLGPAGFWETMALPDVLQHRAVVLLVVALAVFEWLARAGRLRSPHGPLVFPALCAAGGALLLTHSHAMLNLKSELLAEVTHAPMGILAVFMGWARWLELRLPAPAPGSDDLRPLAGWVSAASMLLIGAILLFYREAQ